MDLPVLPGVRFSPTEVAVVGMLNAAGLGDPAYFGYKLYVTSALRTLGDGSGQTSTSPDHHTDGTAVDLGADDQAGKDAAAAWLYRWWNQYSELIHTRADGASGWYVKNYNIVPFAFYGRETTDAHVNHVHLAMTSSDVADMQHTPSYQTEVARYRAWIKDQELVWLYSG